MIFASFKRREYNHKHSEMKYFVPKVNKTILKSSIEKYFVKFAQQKFSENLKVVQPTTHCCLRCWATNRRFSRDLNSLSAHFNLNLFFVCSLVAICWTTVCSKMKVSKIIAYKSKNIWVTKIFHISFVSWILNIYGGVSSKHISPKLCAFLTDAESLIILPKSYLLTF